MRISFALCPAFFLGLLLVGSTARAGVTFDVTFSDVVNSTGVGFDDPTLGAERRSTLQSVFSYVGSVLDHDGSTEILISDSQTDGMGSLASGGPTFALPGPRFDNGIAFSNITGGFDPFGLAPDGSIQFDFGFNYNSGLGATAADQFDLFTVALHETTHFLGAVSLIGADGGGLLTGGETFTVADSLLQLGDGTALFDEDGIFVADPSALISDDLFFGGENTIAANGGNPVQFFAPTTFQSGSSLAHFDEDAFPNAVLSPFIASGEQIREFTAVDLGLLQDIGFSINAAAVPEPSSTLCLVALLGVTGFRRRRRTSVITNG